MRNPRTALIFILVVVAGVGAGVFWTRILGVFWTLQEPTLPVLPTYGLELSTEREPEYPRRPEVRVTADSLLTLVLRPAEDVIGPTEARGYITRGERWEPWAVHFHRSDSGAFALRARVRDLPGLGPGRWRILFLVGRPGSLPADPEGLTGAGAGTHPTWRLLEGQIRVDDGAAKGSER